jgi:hypothetical protein
VVSTQSTTRYRGKVFFFFFFFCKNCTFYFMRCEDAINATEFLIKVAFLASMNRAGGCFDIH